MVGSAKEGTRGPVRKVPDSWGAPLGLDKHSWEKEEGKVADAQGLPEASGHK